ncbi:MULTISPECIES: hypothetical protein [unclassified Herbaspirillum]|uniref:hypothetical protein n=1 Tax=unclassified Herbaspirillum TaxID=2624150 RepID=UPI000E2E81D8|nr:MULTISPECIES: hypothetical protein [unclassified Herbaspirillum]RFB71225.1 hypothetical protein DZB54_11595 [Herbaspirillum sp. 3R-3a1]TFI08238.1 hypothetical protein E4P32_08655 [Herbaspirillum sp. 3R11]TFI14653.1 hypothetical protein E4P31_08650 [Herbaspirillum sp. 3R-11]TFI31955.1 hypothetical protein E4P30_00500 [Herbaspirillum sp. 3C11]TFI31962.1 hypothetical protein E4P30_00540 [Herbaspirillum sp. 3C11]
MIHEVTVYFPWLGACLAVFVLIAAAAIFVLRLYLVESRGDNQWRGCEEFLFLCKRACDEAVTPDEAWWRAEQGDIGTGAARLHRRRNTLRRAIKILTIAALAACALLIAGALSAATATGSIAVSAMVLTRCIIRFPVRGNDADSSCSEGVAPVRSEQLIRNNPPDDAGPGTAEAAATATAGQTVLQTRVVTLTY